MKMNEINGTGSRVLGWRGQLVCTLAILVIALAPSSAWAEESLGSEFGIGMGAGVATLVYTPVKIVYAILGGVFGGFAWVFSGGDNDVVTNVWTPSLRGTYVLTPEALRGEKDIEFVGRDPEYRENVAWTAPEPSPDVSAAAPPERW